MNAPLSAERLAEIRNRRLDEVTPGPWLVCDDQDGNAVVYAERTSPEGKVSAHVLLVADQATEADVQFVASARRSAPELLAEVELLHVEYGKLQRSLNQCAAELDRARADVAADLPRLRADLKGWSERGRKAEDELEAARIEIAELKARAEAGPDTAWFLALYEGAEPELFATLAAAKACCDDLAAVSGEGGDWLPEADGVWQQVRTRDLDDAVVGEAPGSVWRLSVKGAAQAEEHPLAWARRLGSEQLLDFIDALAVAAGGGPRSPHALTEVERAIVRWRQRAETQAPVAAEGGAS